MLLPDVAARLRVLARTLRYPELATLADEIRRRPMRSRAPATMTSQVAATIRRMKAANPNMPQHEIARRLNVNPGRVSEVLRGKRT